MQYIHCDLDASEDINIQFFKWLKDHGINASLKPDRSFYPRTDKYIKSASFLWDAFASGEDKIPDWVFDGLA